MRENCTELVFLLDRSGSMSGLELDTIGGFNSLINRQRTEDGEALVSTILFDDRVEVLHNREDIQKVPELTSKEYFARGTTALLDAMGSSIEHMRSLYAEMGDGSVPAHTMYVITTDGLENASHRYSLDKVRSLVTQSQNEFGWEFIFLGANMDAISAAGDLGIRHDRAATYFHDAQGTGTTFRAMNSAISEMRAGCFAPGVAWKSEVEKDFAKRSKKRRK